MPYLLLVNCLLIFQFGLLGKGKVRAHRNRPEVCHTSRAKSFRVTGFFIQTGRVSGTFSRIFLDEFKALLCDKNGQLLYHAISAFKIEADSIFLSSDHSRLSKPKVSRW